MLFPARFIKTKHSSQIGKNFGDWKVLSCAGRDKKSNILFDCVCKCGRKKVLPFYTLKSGDSTKCLWCRKHFSLSFSIGERFGNSIIIERLPNERERSSYLCRCDCGREHKVLGYKLKALRQTKCAYCSNRIHGMSKTNTHKIWRAIFQRCNNSKNAAYLYYGGRGIKICERWDKFENFLEDMGERPVGLQIDRIDNDGNYEPGNCRWVTPAINIANRSNSRKKIGA